MGILKDPEVENSKWLTTEQVRLRVKSKREMENYRQSFAQGDSSLLVLPIALPGVAG